MCITKSFFKIIFYRATERTIVRLFHVFVTVLSIADIIIIRKHSKTTDGDTCARTSYTVSIPHIYLYIHPGIHHTPTLTHLQHVHVRHKFHKIEQRPVRRWCKCRHRQTFGNKYRGTHHVRVWLI